MAFVRIWCHVLWMFLLFFGGLLSCVRGKDRAMELVNWLVRHKEECFIDYVNLIRVLQFINIIIHTIIMVK